MMKKFMEEAVPKYLQFLENDIGKFGKDGFAVSRWVSLNAYFEPCHKQKQMCE